MSNSFSYHVTKYFAEYLPLHLGVSKNTCRSYRDAFVLFLGFMESQYGIHPDKVTLDVLDLSVVESFLVHLEEKRGAGVSTRNHRLAAIHSFFRYLQRKEVTHFERCSRILAIPFKKCPSVEMSYLSLDETRILLSMPNPRSKRGMRELAMLSTLYETGARVQELVDITVSHLHLSSTTPCVDLRGKGNKLRRIPISEDVAEILRKYMDCHHIAVAQDIVFPNNRGEKLTRAGVQYIIDKNIALAKKQSPDMFRQKITNHSFRHSKAMHLLEAGVNLVYIRDFLGHSSVVITEIYAKTNPEIKRKLLTENSMSGTACECYSAQDRNDLLDWLKNTL